MPEIKRELYVDRLLSRRWNGKVKIDKDIPNGYSRMSAKDLFSMFSN